MPVPIQVMRTVQMNEVVLFVLFFFFQEDF